MTKRVPQDEAASLRADNLRLKSALHDRTTGQTMRTSTNATSSSGSATRVT